MQQLSRAHRHIVRVVMSPLVACSGLQSNFGGLQLKQSLYPAGPPAAAAVARACVSWQQAGQHASHGLSYLYGRRGFAQGTAAVAAVSSKRKAAQVQAYGAEQIQVKLSLAHSRMYFKKPDNTVHHA